MKALLITLAILIVVGVGAGIVLTGRDNGTNESQTNTQTQTTQTTQTQTNNTSSVNVSISNSKFPSKIKVSKGTTVTWTNQDSVAHTVTSDDDSDKKGLDSPSMREGQIYSFTFNEVGVYQYHCTPHPFMTGTVEVVEENIQEVEQ